ncbi:MAG: Sua5/YciO/YrdC/YwlC family protein [Gammaproteobacteria bacterium]
MPSSIHYRKTARLLQSGGVIAYPTEGVYGLGCAPDDAEAVMHILNIKSRRMDAGLILISPNLDLLLPWINPSSAELQQLNSTQPNPVTWIVTAAKNTPEWLTGGCHTLAVRITDHPDVTRICLAAGFPLVSTSANRSGRPPARTRLQAHKWLGQSIDEVTPGALGDAAGPSEIRVAQTDQVLRPQSST